MLLKLGSDMGLDVWVAKNDKNKAFNGQSFASIPKLKCSLTLQFDEATTRTIELIDVIWLKGNSIQAAFEIESTTSIFSGLLRMSDLITMQPNLNIPLFICRSKREAEQGGGRDQPADFCETQFHRCQRCAGTSLSGQELRRQLRQPRASFSSSRRNS